nr:MAG TPA: hypothetical protein [Caudoviricetes sp.]
MYWKVFDKIEPYKIGQDRMRLVSTVLKIC